MTECRRCGAPILKLASMRPHAWCDLGGSLRCMPDGPYHEPPAWRPWDAPGSFRASKTGDGATDAVDAA